MTVFVSLTYFSISLQRLPLWRVATEICRALVFCIHKRLPITRQYPLAMASIQKRSFQDVMAVLQNRPAVDDATGAI